MKPGRYMVTGEWGDEWGTYPTFDEAVARGRDLIKKGRKCISVVNLDNVDLDWADGLTEEQREEWDYGHLPERDWDAEMDAKRDDWAEDERCERLIRQ